MEQIFLRLLNLSISAAWLVLGVLVLRLLLKKAPKWVRGVLWSLVGLRLALPFSLESVFSLIPSAETVPPEILTQPVPQIHSGVPVLNSAVNPILEQSFTPQAGDSANPMQIVIFICSVVWLVGLCAMLCYLLISYLRIRFRVRERVKEGEIYLCDRIPSPFILGIFRPRIYVPSSISLEDLPYVLAHEQAHLRRHDHLWKPFAFLLLSIYWFQPILWIAYILLCRDIELACDEKVLKELGSEGKKPYSSALLNCAVPRKMLAACPLAFGEVSVKTRIKSILNYKKPAFWLTILALIACTAAAVCLLTSPPKKEVGDNVQIGTPPEGFAASCEIREATRTDVYIQDNTLVLDYRVRVENKTGMTQALAFSLDFQESWKSLVGSVQSVDIEVLEGSAMKGVTSYSHLHDYTVADSFVAVDPGGTLFVLRISYAVEGTPLNDELPETKLTIYNNPSDGTTAPTSAYWDIDKDGEE